MVPGACCHDECPPIIRIQRSSLFVRTAAFAAATLTGGEVMSQSDLTHTWAKAYNNPGVGSDERANGVAVLED